MTRRPPPATKKDSRRTPPCGARRISETTPHSFKGGEDDEFIWSRRRDRLGPHDCKWSTAPRIKSDALKVVYTRIHGKPTRELLASGLVQIPLAPGERAATPTSRS